MNKINQLREKRNNKIINLEEKMKELQADPTYSAEYKAEQSAKIDKEIEEARESLEPEIYEKIQSYKEDKLQEVHSAEFDITPDEANIELLKELRVQAKATELVNKYQGQDPKRIGNQLIDEAQELIQAKSPYIQSYLTALKQLGVLGARFISLEQQAQEVRLNSKQIKAKEQLEEIKQIEKDFNRETGGSPITEVMDDHFKEILAKYK